MSESADDSELIYENDELPEIRGVQVLTEESVVVPDVENDPFLRTFDEESVPKHIFKKYDTEFKKAYKSRTGGTAKSKQYVEGGSVSLYGVLDVVEPPYNQAVLAKLYETNAIHAAAVDAKIDNIVGLGYYWDYSRKADKIRQRAARKEDDAIKQRVEDNLIDDMHALDAHISELNNIDEFSETLEKVLRDRFTTGNGYFEIGRNLDGSIGYIGHIPALHMRVRRNRDGFVQYADGEPIFFRNFGDRKTPDPFGNDAQPNEIIHYKKHTPVNSYYGVPEIVSAADNIAGIEFANQYNIEYFQHKAVPRYIITTSGCTISRDTHAKLLRFFETQTKGKHHRSMVVPLPNANAKIEFTPVETKKQEASFVEYIDQNTKHILARHRTPANRLGMTAGTGIGDARDANKMFKETVCNPEQSLLEKKLNRIFREFTDLFTFKLTEYTLTDENEQSQIHERQLRMGQIVPDEARAEIGLPRRPDGNGDQPVDNRSVAEMTLKMQAEEADKARKSSEKMARESAKVASQQQPGAQPTIGGVAGRAASQQKAQANQSRTRNANQSANKTDGTGATQSRNAKGTGAKRS